MEGAREHGSSYVGAFGPSWRRRSALLRGYLAYGWRWRQGSTVSVGLDLYQLATLIFYSEDWGLDGVNCDVV
jgi:hypothetical protein